MSQRESLDIGSDFVWDVWWAMTFAAMRELDQVTNANLTTRMLASHHDLYFLPGLEKLGLHVGKSDAVRCAEYHYQSNMIAGINMGLHIESPKKAWLFYLPPFRGGIGLAGLTTDHETAPWWAWHARNGESLGNLRLGYVTTHMIYNGDPFHAGYWIEEDHDLEPHERLRLRFGQEEAPPIVQPPIDTSDWPAERLARARRNSAIAYLGGTMWAYQDELGVERAARTFRHAFGFVLFQEFHMLEAELGVDPQDPRRLPVFWHRLVSLMGDEAEFSESGDGVVTVRQGRSRLHEVPEFQDPTCPFPREYEVAVEDALRKLALRVQPGCRVDMTRSPAAGDSSWEWRFTPRPAEVGAVVPSSRPRAAMRDRVSLATEGGCRP